MFLFSILVAIFSISKNLLSIFCFSHETLTFISWNTEGKFTFTQWVGRTLNTVREGATHCPQLYSRPRDITSHHHPFSYCSLPPVSSSFILLLLFVVGPAVPYFMWPSLTLSATILLWARVRNMGCAGKRIQSYSVPYSLSFSPVFMGGKRLFKILFYSHNDLIYFS
jgi:hypothetical protein